MESARDTASPILDGAGRERDLSRQLAAEQGANATLRREVERLQALHEQHADESVRFALVSQATSEGLWDMSIDCADPLDPDNRFWCSEQFRHLLQYGDDQDCPHTLGDWAALLHPDHHAATLAAFAAHLADRSGATPYDVSYQMRVHGGDYRWFRSRGATFRDAAGRPLRMAGAVTDITALRITELEKERVLTRFDLSRELLSDGIWDMEVIAGDPVNPRNPFWWSRQFRSLLGYAGVDEFPDVLDSWASRLHPDEQADVLAAFRAHLVDQSGRTPYDIEYRLRCADGAYRWFRARGQTRRDGAGVPLRVVGVLSDITSRKREESYQRAQAAHAAAARISHQLVENTSEGVLLLTGGLRIVSANKAVARLTGREADRLTGLPLSELLRRDETLAYRLGQVLTALRGAGHWAGELEICGGDGKFFPAQFTLDTMDTDADGHYSCVFFDASERKLAEEQRAARQRAEDATAAKSRFLANMSHELRTPLNAILGFSELLCRDPELSTANRETLEIIHRSGDHLLVLINDVLDIAKIEADQLVLKPAPFDLPRMVADVRDMLLPRAREQGVSLHMEQAPDFPRYIQGDSAKLRQVMLNLISNAVKASADGAVVALRLSTAQGRSEQLLIEVEDHGVGIAEQDQLSIFEPFVQVGDDTRHQGTGLGLAISRRIVELMGGTLTFSSALGQGSNFRVSLPVRLVRTEQTAAPPGAAGIPLGLEMGQRRFRVMVVEDQAENRLLLVRLLAGLGFDIREAADGAAAVELYTRWRPDFIWMDRRMPLMDGVEATQRIRALPGGRAVRIVAITASSFKEQDTELTTADFDAIVHKPWRIDDICNCMESLLGLHFRRGTAPQAPAAAAPQGEALAALDALAPELREQLAAALLTLNGTEILKAVDHIALSDAALAASLRASVQIYDYQPILRALRLR
ncbi:PAS domain-containing protein [Rugamonas sp.]|uniref:PAS domain-containing protein n=1 Tax=Rugamonas sp. TaxID=1926287 RepID=UPI0025E51518|nr:PAS domain-containing protein [Rugamonas sp.]